MALNQAQNAFDLLGQGVPSVAPQHLPGAMEPQLDVAWGSFHQGFGSSIWALFGPRPAKDAANSNFFRDCLLEARLPQRALLAAALWHIVFLVMPSPRVPGPRKVAAFENTEITWSGPINDLPLLEIPKAASKSAPKSDTPVPEAPAAVDAFHPRQRIFTDPVHPTHPRQTLINPAAPPAAPKLLPSLPNIVQLQQAQGPARPRIQLSDLAPKQLHPREKHVATPTDAPAPDVSNADQHLAEITIAAAPNAPARPKLELNAGAAPRAAKRAETSEAAPAPDVAPSQATAANGAAAPLIALSANPAPPAPVAQPPQGNLAARVAISPEGKHAGPPTASVPAEKSSAASAAAPPAPATNAAGKNSVGVSISGGSAASKVNVSGLGPRAGAGTGAGAGAGPGAGATPNAAPGRIAAPSAHVLLTRPQAAGDAPERSGPPDFAALPPGAKPEQVFAYKKVYTLNVNMPNLNSSTGSWILNFSELRSNPDGPHITSTDLSGPVPLKKVDPKYPPTLISDRVEGEVVLYAVIRRDGSVDSIQVVRGLHEQLDDNAMEALAQWKFRPASRQGVPVELEAIVHIPFHPPEYNP
jgi:TonB family protein